MDRKMKPGNLFIISAPSGTGKTTILKKIMAEVPGVVFSVSHTTREPRDGERQGVDYYFVDRRIFAEMRDSNAFLEWAEVHGEFYGTSKNAVARSLDIGLDVILDIDVQGARQIRAGGTATFIFIVPPSLVELEKRLRCRGTDSAATIALRLRNARREMADIEEYEYVIVNDDVDVAADTLRAIIVAARSGKRRSPYGQPLHLPDP